jgi:hypothetical protein
MQGSLFAGGVPLETRVLSRRKDFRSLFEGFTRMHAVSYVASPDLLLEFLDELGFTELEVVVGDSLSEPYKRALEQKGVAVTARLAELVTQGRLRILVPDRLIHTKMYLLDGADRTRVIQTSANLTRTAQEPSRQINYAWYVDLPHGDPLLERVTRDYQAHASRCTLFMEDLTQLFRQRPDMDRGELVEVWLKGAAIQEEELEVRRVFDEIASGLALSSSTSAETLVELRLPEAPAERRRIERLLAPLEPAPVQNRLQVRGRAFVDYVRKAYGVPLLRVNPGRHEMLLAVEGSVESLAEAPPDPASVNAALEHLEDYLNTVDTGHSADPRFAKMSMFEALLYFFSAPFFHEYMKRQRERFGPMGSRGPRFLYIYGPSQNGKSTFLQFALKVMTGRNMQGLSGRDFTKTRIANAAMVGTAFPLVFDDVSVAGKPGIEEVFKSYWERWWRQEYLSPQLIMTSNTARLRDWAKSRVKRVDFDVQFAPTERDKETLFQLFSKETSIFKWFCHLYFEHLESPDLPSDDELYLARSVMSDLYHHAGRKIPEYLPQEPLERIYDPGLRDWRDLLFGIRKAALQMDGGRILVELTQDIQPWEVNDYQSYLPQTIKFRRRGHMLIIENPEDFEAWLGPAPRQRSWLRRFFSR